MSSETFVEGPKGVLAAWETSGQVFFGRIDSAGLAVPNPIAAPGDGRDRKHPSIAANERGETLLAWTEGTGWQRGGALAWQMYDADGRPSSRPGRIPDGIPTWGLPTAVSRPDGSFLIIY